MKLEIVNVVAWNYMTKIAKYSSVVSKGINHSICIYFLFKNFTHVKLEFDHVKPMISIQSIQIFLKNMTVKESVFVNF